MSTIMAELRALADEVSLLRKIAAHGTPLEGQLADISARLHTLAQRMEQIMRDIQVDPRD